MWGLCSTYLVHHNELTEVQNSTGSLGCGFWNQITIITCIVYVKVHYFKFCEHFYGTNKLQKLRLKCTVVCYIDYHFAVEEGEERGARFVVTILEFPGIRVKSCNLTIYWSHGQSQTFQNLTLHPCNNAEYYVMWMLRNDIV